MWKLLRADVTQLTNLFRHAEGRKALAVSLVGYFFLGLGGLVLGGRLLLTPELRAAFGEAPEILAPAILGTLALGPALLGSLAAIPEARSQLFGPSSELLLTAPVRASSILLRTWARAAFTTVPLAWVVGLPAVVGWIDKTPMGPQVALAWSLVTACLTLAGTGLAVAVVVVLRRFFSAPRLRWIVNLLGTLLALALTLFFGAGFVAGKKEQAAVADLLSDSGPPSALELPGEALAAVAGHAPFRLAQVGLIALPFLGAGLVGLASTIYRRAQEAGLALSTRVGGTGSRRRRWPPGKLASLLWRDLLLTVQERMSIAAYAFLGVTAAIFATGGMADPGKHMVEKAPPLFANLPAMVVAWVIFLMLLTTLQGLGLLQNERRDHALLATAPVGLGTVVSSKLVGLLPPLVWSGTAFLGAGLVGRGLSAVTMFWSAMAMVPAAALLLLPVFGVATLLFLQRGEASPTTQVNGMLLVSLFPTGGGILLLLGVNAYRSGLSKHFLGGDEGLEPWTHTWTSLGLLWGLAAVVGGAGLALAFRNYQRLLGPEA